VPPVPPAPFASLVANIPPPPFRGEDGVTALEIGPLSIAMYGLLIAIGAYLGLLLLVKRYSDMGGDAELAERTALLAVGAAIVGSRIGYIIPRLDHFLANPLQIPQIWQGGLAFFGGVALAVPVAWWYAHSRGGNVAWMIDAAAPALPLGHAIGRWGNYFNQELYGRPTDLPWALEVEAHRRVAGFSEHSTFHPTFLYESLWNLALVGVLLWLDRRRDAAGRRRLRRGSLGFLYLVGYGLGRFWTELLRIDTADRYVGLSRNNWIALLVIVVGIVGLLWWERRGTAEDTDPNAADDGPDTAGTHDRTEVAGPDDGAEAVDDGPGPSDERPPPGTEPDAASGTRDGAAPGDTVTDADPPENR
jgi:prolipoprotein diacylglyceryl transferase